MVYILTVIADNLVLLVGVVASVAVVALLANALVKMHSNRYQVKMTELMLQQSKLQIVQHREYLQNLSAAAVLISDDEKIRIDAIREDLATLSRKAIALTCEVDARTTRLERGVEIGKMASQLEKIRKNEAKLFNANA
jgi:hypothetical protein